MASVRKPSGLSTRSSPYNASVTLFERSPSDPSTSRGPSSLQSKPPMIHRQEETAEQITYMDAEIDIEDVTGPSKSRPKGKAKSGTSTRKRKEAASPSVSPKKSKTIRTALDIPHPAPEDWEQTYAAIKEMRKDGGAPVDEMGCHMAGGPVKDAKTKRFVTLISLMLSSQTKDEVTHTAVSNLRASLGELTVENVLAADLKIISDAIGKVGFWRRKTQYIKQAAQKIQDEFSGEIPNTVDGLCSLPGVGPKMAFLALQVAWNLNMGIGVDVHVHRITNRLGWHKVPTKEPEQTRLNLQSWLPTDLHPEINPLLVGFGQTICLPASPRCDICTLSSKHLCPSAKIGIKSKTRKAAAKVANVVPKVTVELEESLLLLEHKTELEGGSVELESDVPRHVKAEHAKQGDR